MTDQAAQTPSATATVKPEKPKDTFSLRLVKLNTYITRSKWMLGVYAGFILLLGNETLKNKELENKIIITGSIVGVILLSFAVVNFEQHLVEIRKALYEGKKGKEKVDITETTYNTALTLFGWNLFYTGLIGLSFICFLWFSWFNPRKDDTSINLSGLFYYQTKTTNIKYPAIKHSITLNSDSSYVLKDETVSDSLALTELFSKNGKWTMHSDSIIHCTSRDTSFYLKALTDKILIAISQNANEKFGYLYQKDTTTNN
jgi:NlpE N-terminal domain